MNFGIANYSSEEITSFSPIIHETSMEIQEFLKNKDLGVGIQDLYIGFICVNPSFDQFFMPKQKYSKSKRMLEYDFKEDFETFRVLDDTEARRRLLGGILNSIDGVLEKFSIQDFDVVAYKHYLMNFFRDKQWIK